MEGVGCAQFDGQFEFAVVVVGLCAAVFWCSASGCKQV
jgi:hypothetical protein